MLYQSATRFHQPPPQTGQRYLLDPIREMLQSASRDELHSTDGKSEPGRQVDYMQANGLPSIWRR
jgi:hypothetical protein